MRRRLPTIVLHCATYNFASGTTDFLSIQAEVQSDSLSRVWLYEVLISALCGKAP